MMTSMQKQLLSAKKKYSLTTSDMSVLLDVHRSTVLSWENGVNPFWTRLPQIKERLALIDKAAKKFPVPLNVTQYQRKTYLLDAINVSYSKLPKSGSSTRR